jgi:phosphinothricin acetyltransferase
MTDTNSIQLRRATKADLPAINAIYNHYVEHSTCTYQTEPETAEARQRWFDAHDDAYPVTVVQIDGQVVAWGSLSRFHVRAAYKPTVENSVYVHHAWQRRGLGRMLLADLIERARALGYHSIIAGISADQQASVTLHARLGFEPVGQLCEVGYKFDRWLDVLYMQKRLEGSAERGTRSAEC